MSGKTRKDSIYIIYEGYRDGYFLNYLAGYSKVSYNSHPCNGGSANQIVTNGIKHSYRDVNVYVFFDEDFESKPGFTISDETLEGLEIAWKINQNLKGCAYRNLQTLNKYSRNPILIVSHPHSIEGLILRILGNSLSDLEVKSTKQLKNMIDGYLSTIKLNNYDTEKIQSHNKKITKYSDEIAKLQQSKPYNVKHCQFLESLIEKSRRSKNEVTYKRFLSDKLPLSLIAEKREDIQEVDILLKAFGL